MAGFAIALALLVVGIVCVPLRLWASRMGASLRRGPTVDGLDDDGPLDATGLAALRHHGRRLVVLVDLLHRLAPRYRETLPYVSLFFADPRQGLHVRRDRRIVEVRQDFEAAIERLAEGVRAWSSAADALDARDRALLEAAGGAPASIRVLLAEVGGLPRSTAEARRWRFCEETELDELIEIVDALAEDLRGLELAWSTAPSTPYR